MRQEVYYPLGQQSFRELRSTGCVYVDKTRYIERLIAPGNQYVFLARPRRFGKSLFLSTLECFFRGERDLFKGLYADTMEWDWEEYPVLRLDLNPERYSEEGRLDDILGDLFDEWEEEFGVTANSDNLPTRFRRIIKTAHEKTGKKVVILVDEYDKPLVGNLNRSGLFGHYRDRLAGIYGNFKSSADHIRLVFMTGVSRFSKLSVFSGLNNISDITFEDEYADICGITEREMLDNFRQGIELLAEKYHIGFDEACGELKKNYDGYRFAPDGSDIYNPWSLLSCLKKKSIANYWNETGNPTIIVESLKRLNVNLRDYLSKECRPDDLWGLDLENPQPLPLMYQTGYLTIKRYDLRKNRCLLGVPNEEVMEGLMDNLLPTYARMNGISAGMYVLELVDDLEEGKADMFMKRLQAFLAGIPYDMHVDSENNFHNAVYVLLTLIGLKVRTEVHTSDGSIDLLIATDGYVYIIELKYDGTPEQALAQIERKQYALPYSTGTRKVIRIGANFSSEKRRIDSWLINA